MKFRQVKSLSDWKPYPKPETMDRKKKKPIAKESAKRSGENTEYRKRNKVYLLKNRICKCCGDPSTEVHHMDKRNGARLLVQKYWLPVCGPCHKEIHAHTTWARNEGYLI